MKNSLYNLFFTGTQKAKKEDEKIPVGSGVQHDTESELKAHSF